MHHHHDDDFDDDDLGDVATLVKPDRDAGRPPKWYRPRLAREDLSSLNRKSDVKGFAQTIGYLAIIALTGWLFVWTCRHHLWFAPLALALHGGCCSFLINGFHELVHESVFKTRWLNGFFLYVFAFLGWFNPVQFWASHTEHHKFTLHPPDDLEGVFTSPPSIWWFVKGGFANVPEIFNIVRTTVRLARGKMAGGWETHLFTEVNPQLWPAVKRWARLLLIGHGAILVVSIATGWWPIVIAVSFARFFFGGIHTLCNASQHLGLVDNVPDFRLCCRTIYLNPALQFLYWHMNFHTEHHMYAGVPCYNLPRLHRLIKHEMPECPRGLVQTWRQIGHIIKRQRTDPTFQFVPVVPNRVVIAPTQTMS